MEGKRPMPERFRRVVEWAEAAGYKETDDPYSWVPTSEAYIRFVEACPGVEIIRREFGLAFHLAFPNTEHVRRRIGRGRQARGWAYLTGPGERRSTDPGEGSGWKTPEWLAAMERLGRLNKRAEKKDD